MRIQDVTQGQSFAYQGKEDKRPSYYNVKTSPVMCRTEPNNVHVTVSSGRGDSKWCIAKDTLVI